MTLPGIAPGGSAAPASRQRPRPGREEVAIVLAGLAAGLTLAAILVVVSRIAFGDLALEPPRTVDLVVAPGTAKAIRSGDAAPVANRVVLAEGDRLVVRNQDAVAHTVAGLIIAPGGSLTMDAGRPATSSLLCSIHPSGELQMVVRARPQPVEIALATLLIGTPIGAVLAAAALIVRRLADESAAG